MAGFGVPISSIPNTSGYNVTSPVSSAGFGGSLVSSAKPTGMDPFSIGLGVASIGASLFGANAQKNAADRQADATAEAARIAAASTENAAKAGLQAQLAGQLGGFGLDYLTSLYETNAGARRKRGVENESAIQQARIQAFNPAFNTLRSVERYEERLRNAFNKEPLGYANPFNTFV